MIPFGFGILMALRSHGQWSIFSVCHGEALVYARDVFDEIDCRENDNPNDIDEVPI
jgi:hypothetical protein